MNTSQNSERVIIEIGTEGKASEASAKAVGGLLLGITALAEDVHREFASNNELVIKARPFTKGSLEVPLDFILVRGTLVLLQYPQLEKIFEAIRKYFELKQMLKGSALRKEGDAFISIENSAIEVDKLVLNVVGADNDGDRLVGEAFSYVQKDKKIAEVKICVEREQRRDVLVDVKKDSFTYYTAATQLHGLEDKYIRDSEAGLLVISPVLSGQYAWKFEYRGKMITATVTDEIFNAKVRDGESFAAGDALIAEMDILQKYNKEKMAYENRAFTVISVIRHIERVKDLFEM